MSEPKAQMVAAWLAKAEEDLAVASLLIHVEKRLLGAGAYHCQQAAEKALKAWLSAQAKVFPKTHDLEVLLHLAAGGGQSVPMEMTIAACELTPLATVFRYPGDLATPSQAEAVVAFDHAELVVNHVRASLQVLGY